MSNRSILMTIARYRGNGGHEIVINNLCQGLRKLGYDAYIGSFDFLRDPPASIPKVRLTRLKTLARSKDKEFDIVHNHQTQLNYYSFLSSTPFIFHYHGVSGLLQTLNLKTSFFLCRNRISRIISVSNYGLDILKRMTNVSTARVIYNGVDTSLFNISMPVLHKKGDPQLLFVGVLYSTKNVEWIVNRIPKILAIFPEAHFQVIGDGVRRQSLIRKIKSLHLESSVELLGNVSNEDLPQYYSSCDVYVSASTLETFDLPAFEAMASGKPLLLSDIPSHEEIVKKSNAGKIFPLNNDDSFIDALKSVYDNRNKYGRNGRTFAELNDWKNVCTQVADIYESLLRR